MLTAIVIIKALLAIAGLALLGRGILYLLAGSGRETNVFYRTLTTLTKPATVAVRAITPRRLVPDQFIGFAAFFLVAGLYLALVFEQTSQCTQNLKHQACERLAVAYKQRCVAGDTQACERLVENGMTLTPSPPATPR